MTITTENIAQAVTILNNGGLVAFPTETVYGLGADAANELAVCKVFQAKGRPSDHPLIVHIASTEQLKDWAASVPTAAKKLAQAFWPGPLTMVLKKKSNVLPSVTGGQNTVALRIPRHPMASALMQAFGRGLVAPSANKFTRVSPTTASAVLDELGASVDLVLDGGACEVGLESTIIDLSGKKPTLLRPGMITREQIEAVLGVKIAERDVEAVTTRAPGDHHVHYAPVTRTQLVKTKEISTALTANKVESPVVFVVYSKITFPAHDGVQWVTMPANANDYARELYRTLRSLDNQHYKTILIEAVPETSEWDAIRDRLTKAAAR